MARCAYCSITILFGGVEEGGERYCNERCRQSQLLLRAAERVSATVVHKKLQELHQRSCPKCKGPGPCDLHFSFRVASALLATEWNNAPQVCCRRCARRSQLAAALSSFCLGWWGVPWGIILTPIQVYRNLAAMLRRWDSSRPSAGLERLVRIGLAGRMARAVREGGTPGVPAEGAPTLSTPSRS
jgi:hypothetical protein